MGLGRLRPVDGRLVVRTRRGGGGLRGAGRQEGERARQAAALSAEHAGQKGRLVWKPLLGARHAGAGRATRGGGRRRRPRAIAGGCAEAAAAAQAAARPQLRRAHRRRGRLSYVSAELRRRLRGRRRLVHAASLLEGAISRLLPPSHAFSHLLPPSRLVHAPLFS